MPSPKHDTPLDRPAKPSILLFPIARYETWSSNHFFIFTIFFCKDTTMASIWTSGSSEGASCDIERNFIWCSTGTLLKETDVINTDNWIYSIPDGNASDEKCLVLNYDADTSRAALQRSKCQGNMPFLCKVKIS